MVELEGLQSGGGDVGAAPHGFGEDDVGGMGAEAVGGLYEVGEAAAEAAAGHLAGVESAGAYKARVGEVGALVVEDGGGADAAGLEQACGGEEEGGLTGSQESAKRHKDGAADRHESSCITPLVRAEIGGASRRVHLAG